MPRDPNALAEAELVPVTALVFPDPCIYRGGNLNGTAGSVCSVTIRDGHDGNDEIRDSFEAINVGGDSHWFDGGIQFHRGLHVTIGAGVGTFVVYFTPQTSADFAIPKAL